MVACCLAGAADPDLERLAYEYLPLTFSRRHGDPSRPWNTFSIEVKGAHGEKRRHYEGNWRDIFQNWEALALSFPGYVASMIFKFADASTADGHNPYRITATVSNGRWSTRPASGRTSATGATTRWSISWICSRSRPGITPGRWQAC